jgi:hypothetical protein
VVIVDVMIVGHIDGVIAIQAGFEPEEPANIALMPDVAESLLRSAFEFAIPDAEEGYWDAIAHIFRGKPSPPEEARVKIREFLLEHDWVDSLARIPNRREGQPVMITARGHIGLAIGWPHVVKPVIAVFDPHQLRRQEKALRAAIRNSRTVTHDFTSACIALTKAHDWMESKPWGMHPGIVPDVPKEVAEEYMRNSLTDHLRRSPFIRPPENDLPE